MIIFQNIRDRALAILAWCGDEAHRRFIVGAIVGACSMILHKEIDSAFVDCVLYLVDAAVLAAWSSRTPKIEPQVTNG